MTNTEAISLLSDVQARFLATEGWIKLRDHQNLAKKIAQVITHLTYHGIDTSHTEETELIKRLAEFSLSWVDDLTDIVKDARILE